MAKDPLITSLRRSERALWRYLCRQADDDGVVPHPIAMRILAEKIEYEKDTVRKAVYSLARQDLCRHTPGIGRSRSLYAVPAVLGARIMEPEDRSAVARGSAPSASAATASPSTGSVSPTAGSATVRPTVVAPPPSQTEIPGIPRQTAPNGANHAPSPDGVILLQDCDESHGADRSHWCDDAISRGRVHLNSRCCHTTPREAAAREAESKKAAAAAAVALLAQEARAEWAAREEGKVERIRRGTALVRESLAAAKQGT